jgi:hypothetical protein
MLTVVIVITYDNLLYLTIVTHLAEKVFVECVKVVLQLRWVHLVLWIEGWVLIEVG